MALDILCRRPNSKTYLCLFTAQCTGYKSQNIIYYKYTVAPPYGTIALVLPVIQKLKSFVMNLNLNLNSIFKNTKILYLNALYLDLPVLFGNEGRRRRCHRAPVATTMFQKILARPDAVEILRNHVLSPIKPSQNYSNTEWKGPSDGDALLSDDNPRVLPPPTATAVVRRMHELKEMTIDIQAILSKMLNNEASTLSGSHLLEAVRQVSWLCSHLDPLADSSLLLFEMLANFKHNSDIYHPKFLKSFPVSLVSESARITLCSRYLSVWRRHIRDLCNIARERQNSDGWQGSDAEGANLASKIVPSSATSNRPGDEYKSARHQYVACPSLHLVAVHELQSQYVAWGSKHLAFALTNIRKIIEECLRENATASLYPDGQTDDEFLLAGYLPSGSKMAPLWKALSKYSSDSSSSEVKDVAKKAVQAARVILESTDRTLRAEVRAEIWLYLQQYMNLQVHAYELAGVQKESHQRGAPSPITQILRYAVCPVEHHGGGVKSEDVPHM